MSQRNKGRSGPIWQPGPLEWNSIFFYLRGRGRYMSWPRPLNFWPIRTVFQGFQMRYITFLYNNWFLRYEPSKLNDRKKSPISLVKRVFFRSFNFDGSYLKNQLSYRNVIYLIWKPWYSAFMSQKAKGFGFQIKLPHALKWNSITFIKMSVVFIFLDYTPCPSGS